MKQGFQFYKGDEVHGLYLWGINKYLVAQFLCKRRKRGILRTEKTYLGRKTLMQQNFLMGSNRNEWFSQVHKEEEQVIPFPMGFRAKSHNTFSFPKKKERKSESIIDNFSLFAYNPFVWLFFLWNFHISNNIDATVYHDIFAVPNCFKMLLVSFVDELSIIKNENEKTHFFDSPFLRFQLFQKVVGRVPNVIFWNPL